MECILSEGRCTLNHVVHFNSALHNMSSKVELQWESNENRCIAHDKRTEELSQLRRLYDQRIESALRTKYHSGHSFEVISPQSLHPSFPDSLNREVDQFNLSKTHEAAQNTPFEHEAKNKLYYPTENERENEQEKEKSNGRYELSHSLGDNSNPNVNSHSSMEEILNKSDVTDAYGMRKIDHEYARFNHLLNGDYPRDYTYRKAVPDKLNMFLRNSSQRTRVLPLRMSYKLNGN